MGVHGVHAETFCEVGFGQGMPGLLWWRMVIVIVFSCFFFFFCLLAFCPPTPIVYIFFLTF